MTQDKPNIGLQLVQIYDCYLIHKESYNSLNVQIRSVLADSVTNSFLNTRSLQMDTSEILMDADSTVWEETAAKALPIEACKNACGQ